LEDTIFPIPIRNGSITVRIQGLPFDLTPAEAHKIAAVILAYAKVGEGGIECRPLDELHRGECVWKPDSDGTYQTSCGQAFVFNLCGPRENGARFCLYCGGVLQHDTRVKG
jgi:hypothetical protein